jgi:hypothetical protein
MHSRQKHTHQVEVNRVVDQVILAWLQIWWRRKVYTVGLAELLDLVISSCLVSISVGSRGGSFFWVGAGY